MYIAEDLLERAHRLRRNQRRLLAALVLTLLMAVERSLSYATFNQKVFAVTSFQTSHLEHFYYLELCSLAGLLITASLLWWISGRGFTGRVMMFSAVLVGAMPLLPALSEHQLPFYLLVALDVPARAVFLTGIAWQVAASRSSKPWHLIIAAYLVSDTMGWVIANLVADASNYLTMFFLMVAIIATAAFLLDSDDHPRPGRPSFRNVVSWTPTAFIALLLQAPFSLYIVSSHLSSLDHDLDVPFLASSFVAGSIVLLAMGRYLPSRWLLLLSWFAMLIVIIALYAASVWPSAAFSWITTAFYLTIITLAEAAILVRILQTPPAHLAYGAIPIIVLLHFVTGHVRDWLTHTLHFNQENAAILGFPVAQQLSPWWEANLDLALCFVAAATVVTVAGYRLWRKPDLGDHDKERDRVVSAFD